MNKKLSVAAVLLVAFSVGFASLAIAATKNVKTTLKVKYDDQSAVPYGESSFTGSVKAKENCEAKRSVSVSGVGKTKTDKKGRFSISAGSGVSTGTYAVKVKKKTIKGKGNKPNVKCGAVSDKVKVN